MAIAPEFQNYAKKLGFPESETMGNNFGKRTLSMPCLTPATCSRQVFTMLSGREYYVKEM